MSVHIEVAVYRDLELVGRRSFEGAVVTVGSAPGSALRFVGVPGIEHSHALVWVEGGVLTVVASSGASLVFEGKVVEVARPGPDDSVTIGPLDLRFEVRDPDRAVPSAPLRESGEDEDEPTLVQRPPRVDRAPGACEDDEDDEAEGMFLEPFSLLDEVTGSSGVEGGELTLQLVAIRSGRLTELATIDRAAQYMPAIPEILARHGLDGTAELSFGRGWKARARARSDGDLVTRPAGAGLVRFMVGGGAVLERGERTLLAFFVRRPRLAPEIGRRGVAQSAFRHGAAAAAVHLALGLVLVSFARPDEALSAGVEPTPREDQSIDLYTVPPDEVRTPPPPRATPTPATTGTPESSASRPGTPERNAPGTPERNAPGTPERNAPGTPERNAPPTTPRSPGATRASTGAGLDDALANLERSSLGAGSLRDAVGAIDVALSSGGAPPGFRLALPVSATAGPGLGGRGGDGGPIEVPLGGTRGVGRFDVPGPGGTDGVGGRVTDAGRRPGPEATIDRALVQRVINQHQHEIVRCYERALLRSPTLSGSVQMGWTIAPGGGVSSVQIRRSTLGDVAVTSCIASAIRGWRFPSPRGGSVSIHFPWAFRPAATP